MSTRKAEAPRKTLQSHHLTSKGLSDRLSQPGKGGERPCGRRLPLNVRCHRFLWPRGQRCAFGRKSDPGGVGRRENPRHLATAEGFS